MEVLAERGFARIKSADIAARAHVSRGTFYAHFENVDACLLAAYEMAANCILDIVSGACEGGGEQVVRLRGAIDTALNFLATEPALAHLFTGELSAGVPAVATARVELIGRLASLLAVSRSRPDAARREVVGDEVHLIEGTFTLISDRVATGNAERLPELVPGLTEVLASS